MTKENKILDELKLREPIFHHPEKFGKTKQDVLDQMCDEFWEVGASGQVYTKQDVVETLLARYGDPWRKIDGKWKILYHQGTIA